MKAPRKRTEPRPNVAAAEQKTKEKQVAPPHREEPREVAGTVKQWAKESVKKTPVDTGEGGSGQP